MRWAGCSRQGLIPSASVPTGKRRRSYRHPLIPPLSPWPRFLFSAFRTFIPLMGESFP